MKNVFTSFSAPNVLGLHGALVVKILDYFSYRRILVFFPRQFSCKMKFSTEETCKPSGPVLNVNYDCDINSHIQRHPKRSILRRLWGGAVVLGTERNPVLWRKL